MVPHILQMGPETLCFWVVRPSVRACPVEAVSDRLAVVDFYSLFLVHFSAFCFFKKP